MTTKQTFWRTLAAAAMFLTMPATVWAYSAYGGGSGTEESPFLISTTDQLDQLAADVNAGYTYEGMYFELTNNLDYAGKTFTPIGGRYYTTSDGATGERKFQGTFNGNSYTISNVTLGDMGGFYAAGIFGCLGPYASVKRLRLGGNSHLQAPFHCGGIAGVVGARAEVTDCIVGADVTISPTDAEYTKQLVYGGVAGFVDSSGTVKDCLSFATVTNNGNPNYQYVGGMVGYNKGSVIGCTSLGTVTGSSKAGDFIGVNEGGTLTANQYNTPAPIGAVNGTDASGVTWIAKILPGEHITAEVLNGYTWLYHNIEYHAEGRKVYLTLSYLKPRLVTEQVTFFANGVEIQPDNFEGRACYSLTIPRGDVTITADAVTSGWQGEGTAQAPFVINTIADMNSLAAQVNKGDDMDGVYFRLNADLDYTGETYTPIGAMWRPFNGTFDGHHHTISNVSLVCDKACQGIFGNIGPKGTVENLTLDHCTISANNSYSIGGIAGLSEGNVSMCNLTKNVTITGPGSQIGGIVGWMSDGSISYCESYATIDNVSNEAGGIVGYCQPSKGAMCSIESCFNNGPVTTTYDFAGGIVGRTHSNLTIMGCINTGAVTADRFAGGMVGSCLDNAVTDCLNLGEVTTSGTNAGGIAGNAQEPQFANNYYAGECHSSGGINGKDVKGQAMRGHIVNADEVIFFQFFPDDEGNFTGMAFDGIYYLGAGETTKVLIERSDEAPEGPFGVTAGTLTPLDEEFYGSTDAFYLLTMPEPGEDVTIFIIPATRQGDVDGNGVVNGSDVTALYNVLLGDGEPTGNADVDGNGTVNGSDVTALYNILLQ